MLSEVTAKLTDLTTNTLRGIHDGEVDDTPPAVMDFIAPGCPPLLPTNADSAGMGMHQQQQQQQGGGGGVMKQPIPDDLDEDDGKCVICLDADATHVFIPCGHRCVCQEHAELLSSHQNGLCPVCRIKIQGSMRVYT